MSYESEIASAAQRYGIDPRLLGTFVKIESGGRADAQTGQYRGLLQLSAPEFAKYGGGDINSPTDNLNAGAAKLRAESDAFTQKYGRAPSANDLYMIHQQGVGGAAAHSANPDRPAWENMLSTAEGQQKGPAWARLAIWGNVPDDQKKAFGSVDNITSKQFTDMWAQKVARFGGGEAPNPDAAAAPNPAPTVVASAAPSGTLAGSLKNLTGMDIPGADMKPGQSMFGSLFPSGASTTTPAAEQGPNLQMALANGAMVGAADEKKPGERADPDPAGQIQSGGRLNPESMQKLRAMLMNRSGRLGLA